MRIRPITPKGGGDTVIYIDILIILNILVDYFLLKLTAFILKCETGTLRILFSSLFGGITSLIILIDGLNLFAEILFNILSAFIMCIIAFGFKHIKYSLKNTAVLFGITYLYGGIMLSLKIFLNPENLAVNNSVVYINISPAVLIISSAVYYIALMILRFFLKRNGEYAKKCTVTAKIEDKEISFEGIIDTGNSVVSVFGNEDIIIVDKTYAKQKIPVCPQNRYRMIPVKTVSGTAVLEGCRIDSAKITFGKDIKNLSKPVLAFSETPINEGEYNAIINPRSIL